MGKLIYYAHSKKIYNTQREKDELAAIEKLFPNIPVICPNRDIGERYSIEPYIKAVLDCDIIVCSEYKKRIGKGVYQEIAAALTHMKEVYVLRKHLFYSSKKVFGLTIEDLTDWKINYGKLVTKEKRKCLSAYNVPEKCGAIKTA